MIALDLCQPHYQNLLIIYLKFIAKSVKGVKKEKKVKSVYPSYGLKNNTLHYKCNECKKRQLKPITGLIKKFPNIYRFYSGDINKFVLLWRKGVYPYEYKDSWKGFVETSLPDKKAFYSELMKTIYMHKKYLKNLT